MQQVWSGLKLVLICRKLSCSRRFLTASTASLVGMHVIREVRSKETMVSSVGRVRFCILFLKCMDFYKWCGVFPTRVDKMSERILVML